MVKFHTPKERIILFLDKMLVIHHVHHVFIFLLLCFDKLCYNRKPKSEHFMAHVIDIIDIMSWFRDTLNTPLCVCDIDVCNNNFATGIK